MNRVRKIETGARFSLEMKDWIELAYNAAGKAAQAETLIERIKALI